MSDPNALSLAAQSLHRNELSGAGLICAQVLEDEPENAGAWHLFGIIWARAGKLEQAKAHFETATRYAPENATYHYSLGLAWQSLAEHEQAASSYRDALARDATLHEARNNLGNLLKEQGALEESIECFRELVRQVPDSSPGHYNLGNLLHDAGKADDAIVHYQRAISVDPDNAAAFENLGRALAARGRLEEARNLWAGWLERDPENAVARHMLASAGGGNIPDRCDDQYVRDTFDAGFARNFDVQLARMDYKAPELVVEAVRAQGRNLAGVDVLDAGCGTGLCGPLIRPMAQRLAGVDLSEDMLVEARKLEVYDETIACELTAYMASHPTEFDLIISADTLCYFGKLEPVMRAACACLRSDGLFVFTVERMDSTGANMPYQLQQHGRYCHAEGYVVESLQESGLAVVELQRAELRRELGRTVEGLIVIAEPARNLAATNSNLANRKFSVSL